ncbi:MAG TPA: OmpA family protein [Candidatus Competibacteraceae bacterium]|nr:OmpA family protein [Candidatus Competibacteraceae bacterium]HSA45946.1 OmpA family protein [Candidatus Competibacteraceae bacterium]
MNLSRLATASLLACTVLATGFITPEAAAQPRSGYEDVDNDQGGPQQGYPARGGRQDSQDGEWGNPQQDYPARGGRQDSQDGEWGSPQQEDQGGGWGRAQQEIEQIITPEYRRLGMRLERLPNGSLRLRLPSEVMFAYDSANISPGFAPTLRKVAGFMERYPRTRARIIGHTDSVGSDSYNLDLSLRRAESAAAFLNAQGVQQRRLLTDGRGKQEPIASNSTPEGRQMNRRVDIIIMRPPRRN